MAPNSPACSYIPASMVGSRSTAPLNRSNSVLIVAPHQRSATTNSQSFHRFVLGLGTDLRVHGPPLSEEFVYSALLPRLSQKAAASPGLWNQRGCSLMAFWELPA